MKKTIALFVAIAATLALAAGCNRVKLPDGMPELFPMKVTVTQDGKPAEGVEIICHKGSLGYGVSGVSDSSGVAELKTNGQFKGAPAGEYTVTATKYELTPSQLGVCPVGGPARAEWEEKFAEEYRPAYNYVNPELRDPATSGLTLSVAKGTAAATLDLGAAVKVEVDEKSRQPVE